MHFHFQILTSKTRHTNAVTTRALIVNFAIISIVENDYNEDDEKIKTVAVQSRTLISTHTYVRLGSSRIHYYD